MSLQLVMRGRGQWPARDETGEDRERVDMAGLVLPERSVFR